MEQKNSRKRLNSLILLVAFTAVMLIVSTYAWFSTQKNVTLGGLQGHVNVAEGLQISLDALNWKNEINLDATSIAAYFEQTNTTYGLEGDAAFSLSKPYPTAVDTTKTGAEYVTTYYNNVIPGEFLPASTIGRDAIGQTAMKLYRGNLTDSIKLDTIHEVNSTNDPDELGYYAIDFFLQNSSSTNAVTNGIQDWIQLEKNSAVKLDNGTWSTGLQNTFRVAFVLYDNAGGIEGDNDVLITKTPGQMDIINATKGQNILDVAIWEPNASGNGYKTVNGSQVATTGYNAHVNSIVDTNNTLKLTSADATTYDAGLTSLGSNKYRFSATALLPTYALTAKSDEVNNINDIYNWNITDALPDGALDKIDDANGMGMQYTTPTTTEGVLETTQLYSAKDGTTKFTIAPGEYHRLTMFVWLEGQDVDTTNWASMGGDFTIDVGLSKPGTANQPS